MAKSPKLPSARAWARSEILETRSAPREPELISDGGGLSFTPSALDGAAPSLDREDPAVIALIDQIVYSRGGGSMLKRRGTTEEEKAAVNLAAWRQLARSEDDAMFGGGRPPELLTAAVHRDPKRDAWECIAVSRGKPLRAARGQIRASSFRPDPEHPPQPEDTELRLLVLEQSRSGGKRAHGRFLAPDLHLASDGLLLRMFVTPRDGFQMSSPNPETPVRVQLPEPLGDRPLLDGAIFWTPPPDPEEE